MMRTKPRLLLIDDGDDYADAIGSRMPEVELVVPDPARPNEASLRDGPSAISFLTDHRDAVDVVLLDMHFDIPTERLFPLAENAGLRRTRRFQGVAILREIRLRFPHLPVVLLTALEDLSLMDAAEDLTSQSMTYILDGHDLDTLRVRVHAAMEDVSRETGDERVLWGDNPRMRTLRRRLAVLSRGSMPLILEGETGTGKSWLAEMFVHAHSGRRGPFVVLDLSTVPTELISAHLFGADKGAYTGAVESRKGVFENAHGGTLLIDEIQNAPLEIQKQLLLVLQDRRVRPLGSSREVTVDVKVIAASNSPLDQAVTRGTFRSDLYMRLSPATRVRIPPLRERVADLPFLAVRFAEKALADPDTGELRDEVRQLLGFSSGTPVTLTLGRTRGNVDPTEEVTIEIPKPAWKMLLDYPWPGNIRELEMVIHNLVTFTLVETLDAVRSHVPITSGRLQVDPGLVGNLLSGAVCLASGTSASPPPDSRIPIELRPGASLNDVSRDVERQYFAELFQRSHRDFAIMARELLGDESKSRAVRLRFNQLGLKVRDFR